MSDHSVLADEVANELATWPGVRIERTGGEDVLVRYDHATLGVLHPQQGVVELREPEVDREAMVAHGDALPDESLPSAVEHELRGPSDVTAVLALFEQRYRGVRGEEPPFSSQDPR